MDKLIVTVAPTGSLPMKKTTPHVPITPEEIVKTAAACEGLGASIIHIHARDPKDETASTDYSLFAEICQGVEAETNLITQISTGGRAGMGYEQRAERLRLKPEMASLTTGSVNFPDSVYANSPRLIDALAADMFALNIKPEMEIFDASMISNAISLVEKGLVVSPLHFDFVMGLRGAIPATIDNLVYLKNTIPAGATWTAAGIGKAQLPMTASAILMGGHARVGLEDNIYFKRGELATNERLVERTVQLAKTLGREIASPDEARGILGLARPDDSEL
ncbi:MAG: 3-keto-5-aminohexanoate cleavage protein [Desulfobacterales bacterium]|nr:3-keto-5-aminohexanoate cleavage protein [Desulfobacterales bacterium]